MRNDARLKKLIQVWPPPACGHCKGWSEALTVVIGSDGPMRPETCPACGRRVPIVNTVAINVPLDPL